MTPADAASLLSKHSGIAAERILNFFESARAASYGAMHKMKPTPTSDSTAIREYAEVVEAATVIEKFHRAGTH
jgi:hypothetical protein